MLALAAGRDAGCKNVGACLSENGEYEREKERWSGLRGSKDEFL